MTSHTDTRAVFVGGPIDGRVMMLPGTPFSYRMDQFTSVSGYGPDSAVVVRHVYYRDDTRSMDGDMIAYEYGGSE